MDRTWPENLWCATRAQVEVLPPPETAVICRDGRLIWNL